MSMGTNECNQNNDMKDIVEQTNAHVEITTDAEQGAAMTIFGITYGADPTDKVTLATFTAPAEGTTKAIMLNTNELEINNYIMELWSNFGSPEQQQHISERFKVVNSNVI